MKRLALFLTILILLILAAPAGVTHAAPALDRVIKEGETIDEDITVFGGTLLIKEGATVNGDVSVFGGSATLDGQIAGDVSIFGGSTTLSGMVDGDLVIVGGTLQLDSIADVDGNCILVGGNVSGDGAAGIDCSAFAELPEIAIPAFARPPRLPVAPLPSATSEIRISNDGGFFGTIGGIAGRSLVLGILALVVASLAPTHLSQVKDAMTRKPAASGAVGLLTAIAGPSLIFLLLLLSILLTIVCIGLLGYPIVLVLTIALVAGGILGWIAAGTWVGQRLARLMKLTNRSLPITAALGTVALTIAAGILGRLPFLLGGWLWSLAALAVVCAGLGAVALTRFGTRPYPSYVAGNGEKVATVLETLPVEDENEAVEKPPAE